MGVRWAPCTAPGLDHVLLAVAADGLAVATLRDTAGGCSGRWCVEWGGSSRRESRRRTFGSREDATAWVAQHEDALRAGDPSSGDEEGEG